MPLTIIFTLREQNHPRPGVLYVDVRPGVREIRRDRRRFKLPLRQYKMLQALGANHPKPMTHWELFYHIWGEGSEGRMNFTDEDGGPLTPNSCIEQHAARLRRNLAFMGVSVNAPRKGYGYQIINVEKQDEETSSQEAQAAHEAPRDPRGSKAEQATGAPNG